MRSVILGLALLSIACGGSDVALFDGRSLTGWHGDARYWRVEEGAIVGTTDGGPPLAQNTFLIHDEPVTDFVLRLQWKIRNGNSGIQFRCAGFPAFATSGYQADIDPAPGGTLGILYEERGRTFLSPMLIDGVYDHVDLTDWNDYEITAIGPQIVLRINDFITVDYTEASATAATEGLLALQLHVGAAMEVRYRDLRLEPR